MLSIGQLLVQLSQLLLRHLSLLLDLVLAPRELLLSVSELLFGRVSLLLDLAMCLLPVRLDVADWRVASEALLGLEEEPEEHHADAEREREEGQEECSDHGAIQNARSLTGRSTEQAVIKVH